LKKKNNRVIMSLEQTDLVTLNAHTEVRKVVTLQRIISELKTFTKALLGFTRREALKPK